VTFRDVLDIRFRLAGYPAIFLLSGSGSGQNIACRRIVQPDNLLIQRSQETLLFSKTKQKQNVNICNSTSTKQYNESAKTGELDNFEKLLVLSY